MPYLLTVPASVDTYVTVADGDPAQGTEEDSQVDVEDVCAPPVKHATLQEDFPTVLVSSGSIHDQIDFRFGPSATDIPSEDSDNVGYGWNGKRAEGFKVTSLEQPLCLHLLYNTALPDTPMPRPPCSTHSGQCPSQPYLFSNIVLVYVRLGVNCLYYLRKLSALITGNKDKKEIELAKNSTYY